MKVACVLLPNFEVAVELVRYPELAGRPIVVGGLPYERKSVRSCSPEAASSGVTDGMPLREAQGLCPEAVFLPADDALYRRALSRVLATLDTFSPRIEAISYQLSANSEQNEASKRPGKQASKRRARTQNPEPRTQNHSVLAYLDASGLERLFGPDEELGERITAILEGRLKLRAQVGIAGSKFVAQMAAMTAGQGKTVVVNPGKEKEFLAPLTVDWIPCSDEMRRRLDLFGLRTMGQLASLPRGALAEQFGTEGVEAARLARGIDERPVVPRDVPVVLSEEIETDPPTGDTLILMTAARQVSKRLERRLKLSFAACQEVSLEIGFENGASARMSTMLHDRTDNAEDLLRAVERLLGRAYARIGDGVTTPPLVSTLRLSLSGFGNSTGEQLELLPTKSGRLRQVQQAVGQAEELFGREAIHALGETSTGRAEGSRVQVIAEPDGRPRVLFLSNRREKVREISNRWRVQEEWWRREVQREYYRIITDAGRLCLIYQDVLGGGWFLERVYG